MLSSHIQHLTPIRDIAGLLKLDGVEIVVSRDLRDTGLLDRFVDAIDAVIVTNADRRSHIAAGVTSAGRTRINTDHAERMSAHAATLEALVAQMRRSGIEIAIAVAVCPNLDSFSTGPLRIGSIHVSPRVLVTTH
jgi:hypothetical protein